MKNLFIIKMITNNQDISDEAFTVWCGLRNLMQKNTTEYFISFNMIAYSVFGRVPNRYELAAMKQGYEELIELGFLRLNNNSYITIDTLWKTYQVKKPVRKITFKFKRSNTTKHYQSSSSW